jgi:hypothetical protein
LLAFSFLEHFSGSAAAQLKMGFLLASDGSMSSNAQAPKFTEVNLKSVKSVT